MNEILEILHPSYVLRNALYGGVLTGLILPLIGVLMYVRRMVFLGVALPQLSATGIAMAVFWHTTFHQTLADHSDFMLAFTGSTLMTTGVLLILAMLERRGAGLVEGRIGSVYVFGGAVTVLLLASERIPEVGIVQLLRGDIIAISDTDLGFLMGGYAAVVAALWAFRKELLLVSVDREMALSLGKRVWIWDVVLYGLVGVTISLGVLMVGPLLTFGFLLLPTMAAVRLGSRFHAVPGLAALTGALLAFAGFIVSYLLDWPTGPTQALLGCLLLAALAFGQWLLHQLRTAAP